MKKRIVLIMLCMMLGITGCSGAKTGDTDKENKANVEKEENTDKGAEKVVEAESNKISEDNTEKNMTTVYPGSDSIVEITMGASENAEQVAVCKIKLPVDYYIASLYMDEAGELQTMLETAGKLVSQVIESDGLKKSKEYCNEVSLDAQGGTSSTYYISIYPVEDYSVEFEKELTSGGVDMETTEGHGVYVCHDSKEQYDFVMAYQISDKWTLSVLYKGQLKDQMSLEEFGKEMCELITPIE